jgi:integrase
MPSVNRRHLSARPRAGAGAVMLIGGADDKLKTKRILTRFGKLAGGPEANILVVSTASMLCESPRSPTKLCHRARRGERHRDASANARRGRGPEVAVPIALAVSCGLRRGESLTVRWRDLDLDAGTLRVRASLQRVGGELLFLDPKTDRARRTVGIPPATVALLRRHRGRPERAAAPAR